MSPTAQAARIQFMDVLREAGWRLESLDVLLETDVDVEPEARADRPVGAFDAALTFHADEQRLGLELVERDGDMALVLRIYPKQQDLVLQAIVNVQDTLDTSNYSALVKSLLSLSELILLETETELLRLS